MLVVTKSIEPPISCWEWACMAKTHPHSTFETDQHCERVDRDSGSGSQEVF